MNILDKAVLVKVTIHQYNAKRQDSKTTREVIQEKNISSNGGKWIKNVIDPSTLDNIARVAQQLRLAHYHLSLPWADDGWRILPTTMYMKYMDTIRDIKNKFKSEVDSFVEQYPSYVEKAKQELNGTYNVFDYLDQAQIKQRFGIEVNIMPVPNGDDFRIKLSQGEIEDMKKSVDEMVETATYEAMCDLWQRIAQPIKHLATKLKDDKSVFRNSIIGNIKEIVAVAPELNIAQDQELSKIIEDCKELTEFEPQELRDSKSTRHAVMARADEILSRMGGYA